jgi:hypothetical protein
MIAGVMSKQCFRFPFIKLHIFLYIMSDILAWINLVENITIRKGGAGSGNFDHSGRPGEVGGSGKGDGNESDEKPHNEPKMIDRVFDDLDDKGNDIVVHEDRPHFGYDLDYFDKSTFPYASVGFKLLFKVDQKPRAGILCGF